MYSPLIWSPLQLLVDQTEFDFKKRANNINNAVSTYLEQSEQIIKSTNNTINRTKDVLVLKKKLHESVPNYRFCNLRLCTAPKGEEPRAGKAGRQGVEEVGIGREGT